MGVREGCAQRSLSAASLFGYFCGDKSNWTLRVQERDDVSGGDVILPSESPDLNTQHDEEDALSLSEPPDFQT
jgi:hypothetical protein